MEDFPLKFPIIAISGCEGISIVCPIRECPIKTQNWPGIAVLGLPSRKLQIVPESLHSQSLSPPSQSRNAAQHLNIICSFSVESQESLGSAICALSPIPRLRRGRGVAAHGITVRVSTSSGTNSRAMKSGRLFRPARRQLARDVSER
jgi:hypothetical protein